LAAGINELTSTPQNSEIHDQQTQSSGTESNVGMIAVAEMLFFGSAGNVETLADASSF